MDVENGKSVYSTVIPAWDSLGVLPPVDSSVPPVLSPYLVSLKEVVTRFSMSSDRREILRGFLAYRAVLHRMGLLSGMQWLDGSFAEDIERIDKRSPRDIDLVTFVDAPAATLSSADVALIAASKQNFKVDAYFVAIHELSSFQLITWTAYWYGLWSHRRNQVWKGFLQIDLAPTEDADAAILLDRLDETQGQS